MRGPLLAILDFEGTSLAADVRATEIGFVLMNRQLEIVEEFETLINPGVEPLSIALSKARLSRSELEGAPTFEEAWHDIANRLDGNVLIAHNKTYETSVLGNELRAMGLKDSFTFACTMEMSRRVLAPKIKSASLDAVCSYFNIERIAPHEALADARDTAQVLIKLIEIRNELYEELFNPKLVTRFTLPNERRSRIKTRERVKELSLNESSIKEIERRVKELGKRLVVITGKPISGVEKLQELLGDYGLHNRETPVTQGTGFVIRCKLKPGKSKLKAAEDLGVPCIEEDDLMQVLHTLGRAR